jgi:hypothetical protein
MIAPSAARKTRPRMVPTSSTEATAAKAFTRPQPLAGSGTFSGTRGSAVRLRMSFTSPGVRSGRAWRSSAATPATWGVAMLVPVRRPQPPPGTVEVMATPGATTSGLTSAPSERPRPLSRQTLSSSVTAPTAMAAG